MLGLGLEQREPVAARGAFQVPTEAVGFEEGHHVVRHLRVALRLAAIARDVGPLAERGGQLACAVCSLVVEDERVLEQARAECEVGRRERRAHLGRG